MDNDNGTAVAELEPVAAQVAETEDTAAEVLNESPDERIARLEAENAKFKEAEKRREAGKKGAENSLKKERDEALETAKQLTDRIAQLEQRNAEADRKEQQRQATLTLDQHLAQRRKALEMRGLDDDTIEETLTNEKRAYEANAKAEAAEREKARVVWSNDRRNLAKTLVDEAVEDAAEDGYTLSADFNQVVGNLKLDVFHPNALTEVHSAVKSYIKDLKKQSRAEREQAGRAANAAARKADNPEAMADGGSGSLNWQQALKLYASDQIETDAFMKAMAHAPIDARRKAGLAD